MKLKLMHKKSGSGQLKTVKMKWSRERTEATVSSRRGEIVKDRKKKGGPICKTCLESVFKYLFFS